MSNQLSNILLVDDREENLTALEAVLESPVHNLIKARSGEEALRYLLQQQFAVILLDVHMPGMDGFETARLIRARPRTRDIPIIFITAHYKDVQYVSEGYKLDAFDYITKPFDPEILRTRVAVLVDLHGKTAQVKQQAELLRESEHALEETVTKLQRSNKRLHKEIAERKAMEQVLRMREEQLALILASTGEGIYGIDLDGSCTFANRACIEMLGYDIETNLLGQNMHELIHHTRSDGTPYPSEDCPIFQAFRLGKPVQMDNEVLWRADGSSFPAEYGSYPMQRVGEIVGAVVTIMDITERLGKEAQLLQAQKMEAVGRLTGGIAHDFNNLLTVILGNLQLLSEEVGGGAGEEIDELLEDAQSAARDGENITRRLLAVSRNQSLRPTPVNVNNLITDFGRLLQRTIGEDVELNISVGKNAVTALVDPGQLEGALLNLALNARDAMPNGGTLSIESRQMELGLEGVNEHPELTTGEYVVVVVKDTGEGMTPETQARAMEPFFTTKEVGKGSGLGLSMVYGFAQQSGGSLHISSAPGAGTAMTLYLPEVVSDLQEQSPVNSKRLPPAGSGSILVVEDDPRVRKLAVRSLKRLGYAVQEAGSGVEAKKILQGDTGPTIDLLFTDLVMPGGMNGHELAAWAVDSLPGISVLLTTGFSKGIDKGADEPDAFPLIRKPYTEDSLAWQVHAILAA
ncbi:MAG: response regulator [Gammaproteobacteria bacterium]|nr:response regulator [Gammaproteobacteria bacterium]